MSSLVKIAVQLLQLLDVSFLDAALRLFDEFFESTLVFFLFLCSSVFFTFLFSLVVVSFFFPVVFLDQKKETPVNPPNRKTA